jgi:hypothetical protein
VDSSPARIARIERLLFLLVTEDGSSAGKNPEVRKLAFEMAGDALNKVLGAGGP